MRRVNYETAIGQQSDRIHADLIVVDFINWILSNVFAFIEFNKTQTDGRWPVDILSVLIFWSCPARSNHIQQFYADFPEFEYDAHFLDILNNVARHRLEGGKAEDDDATSVRFLDHITALELWDEESRIYDVKALIHTSAILRQFAVSDVKDVVGFFFNQLSIDPNSTDASVIQSLTTQQKDLMYEHLPMCYTGYMITTSRITIGQYLFTSNYSHHDGRKEFNRMVFGGPRVSITVSTNAGKTTREMHINSTTRLKVREQNETHLNIKPELTM